MLEHTNKQFHAELEATRSMFLQMGGLVESMVLDGSRALSAGELQLVDRVREHERQVNQFEVDIDERIGQLIARNQPTAVDLRRCWRVPKC
jgi:phosphate transport system protein